MDVFAPREAIVADYARFSHSFTPNLADDMRTPIDAAYEGGWIDDLAAEGLLNCDCAAIVRAGKTK